MEKEYSGESNSSTTKHSSGSGLLGKDDKHPILKFIY